MRLEGKRVIITGAASGIGRAGAVLFAREGAKVAALDIDGEGLDRLVAEYPGGQVMAVQADLSDREECRGAVKEAIVQLGGIDVLWAHAGVAVFGDFDGLDLALVDKMNNLNVVGPMIAIGEMLHQVRQQGTGGAIVLTASVSGLVGSTTAPVYSVHKFGMVGMAKALALALGKDGVRVNAVCPGHIRTPAFESYIAKAFGAANLEAEIAKRGPDYAPALGRVGRPEEIAHAALWLASDDASYVTGQAIAIDGGYTAK